jgi:hypothetical protein
MNSTLLLALASLLSGLGAATAAIIAAWTLRAERAARRRQHDLDNLRWITDGYDRLRTARRRAAESILDGAPNVESVRDVLNFLETCGYLVHEDFISEKSFALVGSMSVAAWWLATREFVLEVRRTIGSPGVWVEFEWLAERVLAGAYTNLDPGYVGGFLQREGERHAPRRGRRA